MEPDESRVTAEDVTELNRETLARTAAIARGVGSALLVVGAIGVAAWLWVLLRQQQVLGGDREGFFGAGPDNGDPSFSARIDAFTGSFGYLLNVALVVGFGLALRMLGEYVTSRAGGSLTGVEVGDYVPDTAEEDDEASS